LQMGLKAAGMDIGNTESPVTPVYLNGTIAQATCLVHDLRENYDIFCSMVVYPVVPPGIIILRLIPTASHEIKDVNRTIEVFKRIKENLVSGLYDEAHLVK